MKVVEIDLANVLAMDSGCLGGTDIGRNEEAQDFVDVLNGVVDYLNNVHGYNEGVRNEVMLDITVCMYVLCLPYKDTLNTFRELDLVSDDRDDEDPEVRMRRALDYSDRFTYDYMIDPNYYRERGKELRDDSGEPVVSDATVPLFFKLV
jgi:hypothetical protein